MGKGNKDTWSSMNRMSGASVTATNRDASCQPNPYQTLKSHVDNAQWKANWKLDGRAKLTKSNNTDAMAGHNNTSEQSDGVLRCADDEIQSVKRATGCNSRECIAGRAHHASAAKLSSLCPGFLWKAMHQTKHPDRPMWLASHKEEHDSVSVGCRPAPASPKQKSNA